MFQVKMFLIEVTETVTRSSSAKQGVFKNLYSLKIVGRVFSYEFSETCYYRTRPGNCI